MKLSTYVRAIIRNSTTYTQDALDVDTSLCKTFHSLLRQSESEVREYGVNLEWRVPLKVLPAKTTYRGGDGGTAVDLQTQASATGFAYVGDFHTHPYEEKYGPNIAIGPSNGDWMEWFAYPPQHKSLAVHCVASGSELFVLIFRNRPTGQPDFGSVTSDAARLNNAVRELAMASDPFAMAISGSVTQRRQALEQYLPQVIGWHEEDADAMNRELANKYGHEYYRGPLGKGASHVTLRSNRAQGNWLSSRIWSSGTDRWF